MQAEGAATLLVVTDPFRDVPDKVLHGWKHDQPLPMLVLEHPINNASDEGIEARAQIIAEKILHTLDKTAG